jgi:hypothetical protein
LPAVIDAGAQRAELHAASLSAAHERVEEDRRRHAERMASIKAAESEHEERMLSRQGCRSASGRIITSRKDRA